MKPDSNVPPADFAVHYHWAAGSMPPPYHYEYDIQIGPQAQGLITFHPDYPGSKTPEWKESFAPAPEQVAKLYGLMQAKQILSREWRQSSRPPVGGSSDWLDVTANGRKVSVPSYPDTNDQASIDAAYTAIRACVPQALWDDLKARRDAYERDYHKGS